MFWGDTPDHGLRVYREHTALVVQNGKGMTAGIRFEGWEPFGRFLGKDVPDVPFPRVNDREEFWQTFEEIERVAVERRLKNSMLRVGLPAMIVGIAIWKRARTWPLFETPRA